MATTANLLVQQGTTYSARIAVKDSSDTAINLSGYTTRGTARHSYGSTGVLVDLAPAVVSGSPANWDSLASGLVDIDLSASTTATLPVAQGVYDVEMYNDAGTVTRILQGKVLISPEVTS
jgi:hypothetical protein